MAGPGSQSGGGQDRLLMDTKMSLSDSWDQAKFSKARWSVIDSYILLKSKDRRVFPSFDVWLAVDGPSDPV